MDLVIAIALLVVLGTATVAIWPRMNCTVCGKNRAGQMAGGTIDNPICIDCVDESPR